MSDRGNGERLLLPLLSNHDLHARRTTWRRRRMRRRVAGCALVLAAATGGVVLVASHGHAGPDRIIGRGSLRGHRSLTPTGPPGTTFGTRRQTRRLRCPVERVLSYTSYVKLGTGRKREVALTFDDGPGPYTPKILRVLGRARAPATFFVIGEWARRYPQYVRAETRAGCEVGDPHRNASVHVGAVRGGAAVQIVDAGLAIQRAGAPFPHLWRPPYGAFDRATLAILRELKMLVVLWTVDTSDYAPTRA